MKAKIADIDNPIWETIDTNNIKQIHITPFGYFNVEFKDGLILSYGMLDATV